LYYNRTKKIAMNDNCLRFRVGSRIRLFGDAGYIIRVIDEDKRIARVKWDSGYETVELLRGVPVYFDGSPVTNEDSSE